MSESGGTGRLGEDGVEAACRRPNDVFDGVTRSERCMFDVNCTSTIGR